MVRKLMSQDLVADLTRQKTQDLIDLNGGDDSTQVSINGDFSN